MRKPDITETEFDTILQKEGFGRMGYLGYTSLPDPFRSVSVSVLNAGKRRDDQLAYLRRRLAAERQKIAK